LKKRKHPHSIEEVGRSDNAVGDWQQCAGAEGIVNNIFATTNKGQPSMHGSMEATPKRVISHPALQPHLPTENGGDEKALGRAAGRNVQCDSVPTSKQITYGWTGHNAGFGFLDIARPTLGVFVSLDRL
jgi:hypothetical protein